MKVGEAIYFAGYDAMNLVAGTEPSTVAFGNGETVAASDMTLKSIATENLTGNAKAIGGAEHFNGVQLVANYEYTYNESKIEIVWRSVFRDGSTIASDGSVMFAGWYDYTWIWSSITFCCTVALGCIAGEMTKSGNDNRRSTARRLFITGSILLVAGMLASIGQPIIKRIWSASFTLYSVG